MPNSRQLWIKWHFQDLQSTGKPDTPSHEAESSLWKVFLSCRWGCTPSPVWWLLHCLLSHLLLLAAPSQKAKLSELRKEKPGEESQHKVLEIPPWTVFLKQHSNQQQQNKATHMSVHSSCLARGLSGHAQTLGLVCPCGIDHRGLLGCHRFPNDSLYIPRPRHWTQLALWHRNCSFCQKVLLHQHVPD